MLSNYSVKCTRNVQFVSQIRINITTKLYHNLQFLTNFLRLKVIQIMCSLIKVILTFIHWQNKLLKFTELFWENSALYLKHAKGCNVRLLLCDSNNPAQPSVHLHTGATLWRLTPLSIHSHCAVRPRRCCSPRITHRECCIISIIYSTLMYSPLLTLVLSFSMASLHSPHGQDIVWG